MFDSTELNRRNHRTQKLLSILFGLVTCLLVVPVITIMSVFIYKGGPNISFEFLFSAPTNGMTAGGIFPALLGTILLVVVALIFSVPLGVAPARYLS